MDRIDVRMKVFWQRELWCAHESVSILMLVDGVFRIEHALHGANRKGNRDEVSGGAVAQIFGRDGIAI